MSFTGNPKTDMTPITDAIKALHKEFPVIANSKSITDLAYHLAPIILQELQTHAGILAKEKGHELSDTWEEEPKMGGLPQLITAGCVYCDCSLSIAINGQFVGTAMRRLCGTLETSRP